MNLNFEKYTDGLMPAIVQDSSTGRVLMLGFMNSEALATTRETGNVTFFSRTRQKLWTKGETSGNFLELVSITPDCDNDTLLIRAIPTGAVCHTGAETCFNGSEDSPAGDIAFLSQLEQVIESRRSGAEPNSYVASLFAKGVNKIAQKVGEEAVEVVIAAKDDNAEAFRNEAADLLFHYLILLNEKGISLSDVAGTLAERHKANSH